MPICSIGHFIWNSNISLEIFCQQQDWFEGFLSSLSEFVSDNLTTFSEFNCTIFLLGANLKHRPCFFFEIQRDILSKGLVSRIFVLYHIRNSALKCWQGRCRVTQGRHSLGIFLHFSTMMRFDKNSSGLKGVSDSKACLDYCEDPANGCEKFNIAQCAVHC